MNIKKLPAFLLWAIGGLLSLVTVLPLVCDFLPILTFPGGQLTFLGTRLPNRVTITQINGWTFVGFAGYEMAIAFMGIGAIGLFLALNTLIRIIPIDAVKGIPFNAIIGFLIGIVDILLIVLIYIAPVSNLNNWGFSPLSEYSLVSTYYGINIVGAQIGTGFLLLAISGPIIILGALASFMAKPNNPALA